jgi:hypothetical protein
MPGTPAEALRRAGAPAVRISAQDIYDYTVLDAAEAVCGGVIGADVLEPLESLVEKSLIRQSEGVDGEPRFSMLETIREFALDRSQ